MNNSESYSDVAVLVPCLNEDQSVGRVVRAFHDALPGARVYVYDNGSSDETVAVARAAGAIVRSEPRAGKGWVVRRMFAEIDAAIYVMVDGDDTYDASHAPTLINQLRSNRLDMVVANRLSDGEHERRGHRVGNRLFSGAVTKLFGTQVGDVFSGYRAFSHRLVKSFPSDAKGFEIETDLTVHCLQIGLAVGETSSSYRPRDLDAGSSKLHTLRDGSRIARRIVNLFRHVRPLAFFSLLALIFTIGAWILGGVVVMEYLSTGQIARLPSAVLATGLQIVGVLLLIVGLILDTVAASRREQKLLSYLATPDGPSPHSKSTSG